MLYIIYNKNIVKSMKKELKRDYHLKPKFKKGDVIIRNDKSYNSMTSLGYSQYVNPYHKPFNEDSILTVKYINISEFSNFILKGYVFKEQQHSYDSKIVDIEYDLYDLVLRRNKIKKICTNLNSK